MFPPDLNPTCRKILEAAEPLFARAGLDGVSLRQITTAAGVNLAAINYHFFDKESLYKTLVSIRLKQINRERLSRLEDAEQKANAWGGPPGLPAVLEALAGPMLTPAPDCGPEAPRLLGRLLMEQQTNLTDLIRTDFEPVMTRFGQACRRHAASLTAEDFLWRFSYVVGALHHAALTRPDMGHLTRGICRPEQDEQALASFIAFATRAFGQGPEKPISRA